MELHFLQGSNQDCFMIESCWKYSSVIQTQILACSFLPHCMLSDMNYRIRLSGYDCRLNNSHPSFTCLFKMSYFGSFSQKRDFLMLPLSRGKNVALWRLYHRKCGSFLPDLKNTRVECFNTNFNFCQQCKFFQKETRFFYIICDLRKV